MHKSYHFNHLFFFLKIIYLGGERVYLCVCKSTHNKQGQRERGSRVPAEQGA